MRAPASSLAKLTHCPNPSILHPSTFGQQSNIHGRNLLIASSLYVAVAFRSSWLASPVRRSPEKVQGIRRRSRDRRGAPRINTSPAVRPRHHRSSRLFPRGAAVRLRLGSFAARGKTVFSVREVTVDDAADPPADTLHRPDPVRRARPSVVLEADVDVG